MNHFAAGLIALLLGIILAGIGLANDWDAVSILGLIVFAAGFLYWNYVLWTRVAKRVGKWKGHNYQPDRW